MKEKTNLLVNVWVRQKVNQRSTGHDKLYVAPIPMIRDLILSYNLD